MFRSKASREALPRLYIGSDISNFVRGGSKAMQIYACFTTPTIIDDTEIVFCLF